MSDKSFACRVVTPSAQLFEGQLTYASIPAWDGLFGVLPGRAPILARLGTGALELRVADSEQGAGGERAFFIRDGFVKMAGGELTVLAEFAASAESLTEEDAKAELAAAEARTVPEGSTDAAAQRERITADVFAAKTKLRIAQSHRGKAI